MKQFGEMATTELHVAARGRGLFPVTLEPVRFKPFQELSLVFQTFITKAGFRCFLQTKHRF